MNNSHKIKITKNIVIVILIITVIILTSIILFNAWNNIEVPLTTQILLNGFLFVFSLIILITGITMIIMAKRRTKEEVPDKIEDYSMDRQLALQIKQYEALAEKIKTAKLQRHDMRYHLAALKRLMNDDDTSRLNSYVDKLVRSNPPYNDSVLCENSAVNVIAKHYLDLADENNIDSTIELSIPEKPGKIQDIDLCIIIGNLLENAIEACNKISESDRFIKLNAYMQYTTLVITMDNSFDGVVNEIDGVFYSNKHNGEGIGLSSIHAIVAKYGGGAKFGVKNNVFLSSIYIDMENKQ